MVEGWVVLHWASWLPPAHPPPLPPPRPAPSPFHHLAPTLLQAAEAANREISGDTDEEEEFEEGQDVDVEAGPALAV
jgi:hypothetical protein